MAAAITMEMSSDEGCGRCFMHKYPIEFCDQVQENLHKYNHGTVSGTLCNWCLVHRNPR